MIPDKPPGFADFDRLAQKLVQVPKAEVAAAERKYERQKRRRRKVQARKK